MFLSIHLSVGVFLHCNVVVLNCCINCRCTLMFTHICCINFNKVSVSVFTHSLRCRCSIPIMLQIKEHCSSQAEASANDVRDRGRVEQCLKHHVAEKKITASANKECFAVTLY